MDDDILILADPNGNAWDFAKEVYNKLNFSSTKCGKCSLGKINIGKFNDGEIFVKILTTVRNKVCFFIHDSSMNPQDWAISLVEVNDALMRSSAKKINNILPYIKYSRQDRMTEPRTSITASVLAEMIGSIADRVVATDLHNPASTGAYKIPFDNLKAYPVIVDYLRRRYPDFLNNLVVVAPDVGSAERAKSYAKRLMGGVAIINKSRDSSGAIREMTVIGDVQGKNILIVDDMVDTAGTLCKAAEILKEKGALRIWTCATHGLFSKDAIEKLSRSCFEKVIITDSIPQKNFEKIEVVSLADLFSEVIYRISHGQSVSELFR